MTWDRIESQARSVEIDEALQSQIADPLWMLGRQWQVGEFAGDDAAQPAAVKLVAGSTALLTYRGTQMDSPQRIPRGVPLEAVVETTAIVSVGMAGMRASAESGRQLLRRFRNAGLQDVAERFKEAFPLAEPDHLLGTDARPGVASRMLAARAFSGEAAARARGPKLARMLQGIPEERLAKGKDIYQEWRANRSAAHDTDAWEPQRLEYSFSVAAWTDEGEIVLEADEHHGGHLDWYSFDVSHDERKSHGIKKQKLTKHEVTTIPAPVRYNGMPADRWWEFEDGDVHFGDIDAGANDISSMAVAEFATVYSDDWFYVPLRLPVGTLTRTLSVEVTDTMGATTTIDPATQLDYDRQPEGPRPFRLFELAGDDHIEQHRAPWLLLPPVTASSLSGPALERVELARDEGANLAWAIERLIEGPLGRAVDRGDAFHASQAIANADTEATSKQPLRYGDETWRYRLESSSPPWWIPLIPQRIEPGSAQTILRRARMNTWDTHDEIHVGPKGTLLQPAGPMTIFEEEVPRSGARVERSWQYARTRDGGYLIWMQRSKRNGRGERSSGLRWDILEPVQRPGS